MWECLLEITFERSQHKIDFGRVSGSILGGFGLHFGRFFGAKSEKVALESELKSKPKKKAIKSHASNLRKPWLTGWPGPKRVFPGRDLRGNLSQGGFPREALPGSRSQGVTPRERGAPGEDSWKESLPA